MRKVIYGGACSLDGFVTDRSGSVDWLHFSKDVEQIMAGSWATQGGGGGSMPGMKAYVFSRTLTSAPNGAELVSTDAGEFVRALKSQPGKDIVVMSGGNLASSLFHAGVIDEVGLNIHPVLLGAGTPAFLDPGARVTLELFECRQLDGGCVFVNYRVK
jgi:dihydrofolate reductase